MNNFKSGGFKKGGSFGGRPSFGGGQRGAGRSNDRGGDRRDARGPKKAEQEMFKATCTTCGAACEVPFRPDGQKPVLCRDCYATKNSFEPGGQKREGRERGASFGAKAAPAYERNAPKAAPASVDLSGLMKRIDTLESKLNQVLELIQTPVAVVMEEFAAVAVSKSAPAVKSEPTLIVDAQVVTPKKAAAKKVAKVAPKAAPKAAVKKAPAKKVAKAAKKVAKKK